MEKVRLQDLPTKHEGDGYITLNGEVLPAFKISKLSVKVESIVDPRRFLNERVEQNAVRGLKINGSIGFFATNPELIKAVEDYKNNGVYPNLTLQSWCYYNGNERREVLLTDVILQGITMIDLDDSADDAAVSECDFTANDYQIIQ